MLIVCPNCATSYLIDPASVGSAGRSVRCARCKTTWFAANPKQENDVSAFVDGVIAEAEAQSDGHPAKPSFRPPEAESPPTPASDDFGHEISESRQPLPETESATAPVGPTAYHNDLTPPGDYVSSPLAMTDAPSLVPPLEHAPLADRVNADVDAEDVETFAARRQRLKTKRQTRRRSSRWTAVVLVLFAFNVALIGSRSEVVRYLPQTASLFAAIGLPVNLRNLKFDNVRISRETADGINALVIEGTIVSTSGKPTEVPRLRFAARNTAGQEVYTWTALPSRSILSAGDSVPFTSRLVSPPADANDIMVRFFNAQDATGAK